VVPVACALAEKGVETTVAAACLPGWTRGLCFFEKVVFVGTSRVLPDSKITHSTSQSIPAGGGSTPGMSNRAACLTASIGPTHGQAYAYTYLVIVHREALTNDGGASPLRYALSASTRW